MPFLRINGWRIPVEDSSAVRRSRPLGGIVKTQRGRSKDKRRRIQHPRSFLFPCSSQAEANTLQGLLTGGRGHRWSFDVDLWSFDGVGPELGFTATITGAGGVFGGFATLTSIVFLPDAPLEALWTVLVFRRPSGGGPFVHFAIRSDGAIFVDGVRDDEADATWLQVNGGGIGITGGDDYDDLVLFHFEASDRFIVESHAWQDAESRPFSNLPALEVDGDFLAGRRQIMHGRAMDQRVMQHGGRPPAEPLVAQFWRNNSRNIPFDLVPAGPIPTVFP